ncbi:MAG: ABC transporter ATP-binding protein [Chloroflexi bacterium]|nr:MAG: ABC transporter ATP-binding protein [Chloroflexota bacterium]
MNDHNATLRVEDLSISLHTRGQNVNIVDRISFIVPEGKVVGLVGESGSGKSMTALAIMQLLPKSASLAGGCIALNGDDLTRYREHDMQKVRGRDIALIFQSSKTALNPLMTVGSQIARVYRRRFGHSRREAWASAVDMLDRVGISRAQQRAKHFPHQFSGGMAQRVMIALAVACKAKLLIADEPTTGLDVTTEAQILDLLEELRRAEGSSLLLITHNLGLAAAHCDYIAVMHAGHIVEFGPVREVFHNPTHPYTQGLLSSVARPDRALLHGTTLTGRAPDPLSLPRVGCRFIHRCPARMPQCAQPVPLATVGPEHTSYCHLYEDMV